MDSVQTALWERVATYGINGFDNIGVSPLAYAVRAQRLDLVIELCQAGAEVDKYNPDRITPLHEAASRPSAEIVEYLCQHSGNVNVNADWCGTALHVAIATRQYDNVAIICRYSADVNLQDHLCDHTPLYSAVYNNNIAMVRCLSQHGATLQLHPRFGHLLVELTDNSEMISNLLYWTPQPLTSLTSTSSTVTALLSRHREYRLRGNFRHHYDLLCCCDPEKVVAIKTIMLGYLLRPQASLARLPCEMIFAILEWL